MTNYWLVETSFFQRIHLRLYPVQSRPIAFFLACNSTPSLWFDSSENSKWFQRNVIQRTELEVSCPRIHPLYVERPIKTRVKKIIPKHRTRDCPCSVLGGYCTGSIQLLMIHT
uniref:Uncharacterized protein n=1 Tax=Utricularia reniformis TaxID=192314 RepID=A0A1Y0B3D7_9LAMI|nr:hypothetical protein AEK19_MT1713 [Utricularia reniformis]ART31893.1 hypothetical protein AEK19_MT1713 [Utricularia reniformis]